MVYSRTLDFVGDLDRFRRWLADHGAQLMEPIGEYEVLRFLTPRGTSIVYRRQSGALTFTGESAEAYRSFGNGQSWRALPKQKRRKVSAKVQTLVKRDGGRCFYCGAELDGNTATVEHAVPVAHGGPNHLSNLLLACEGCNREAGTLSVAEKVQLRERKRRERPRREARS